MRSKRIQGFYITHGAWHSVGFVKHAGANQPSPASGSGKNEAHSPHRLVHRSAFAHVVVERVMTDSNADYRYSLIIVARFAFPDIV